MGEIVLSKTKWISGPSSFANLSQKMMCEASKGRWRLLQQVEKEHTMSTFVGGFGATLLWISWSNFDFGVFWIVTPTWLIDNGTGVSRYLSICPMSNSCLQGMVQDVSEEIASHWYSNEIFVFARHFVTKTFRSKLFDLLLLYGVLVGVWIIIAVFDETVTCTETNGSNVG